MRNILLIDDDERIIRSLSIWFKESIKDAVIRAASNLDEARVLLKKNKMDLIVSDYDLGQEKGTQLFEKSDANLEYACPVIFLTGQGTKEVMKEIANKQVYKIIEKGTTLFADIEPIIKEALIKKDFDDKLEKLNFIGNNTSTLIHEINNPLTVILAKSEMLQRKLKAKYPDLEQDESIMKNFKSLENASQRLLALMRKTKGAINGEESFVFTPIKLSEFLDSFFEENRELIFKERTLVETNIENDFYMKVDLLSFYQVFSNLLSNSIDALNSKNVLQKKVSITARTSGCFNEIIFEDNGPGISNDIRQKVFDQLFTTKIGDKGTGIGLAVCKNIINKHMGDFSLDPETEKAKFIIKLPVVTEL